ncbi:hypothetical protein CDL15_Pgr006869 [Punica granatum]|uniref:EF-hand domain-containing protein n=1 Tax=Punica granatum TaxID=22663 RepID=A0A218X7Q5_PUNGR|nr:hypothetical protein CDL15_Pgr006869 [Punica granatum]
MPQALSLSTLNSLSPALPMPFLPRSVKLDEDQIAELREIFHSFDKNGDGSLTELELGSLLRSVGLKPSPEQLEALTQKP